MLIARFFAACSVSCLLIAAAMLPVAMGAF